MQCESINIQMGEKIFIIKKPHSPPPLFAFFVWNGNKIALVQYVDQRSGRGFKKKKKFSTSG